MSKFKSRKFWVTLLATISTITGAFVGIGGTLGQVVCIVGAIASVLTYVITEGTIDAKAVKASIDIVEQIKTTIKEIETDKKQ